MRLPSFADLGDRALRTVRRFPGTLLMAVIGAVAFIVDLEMQRTTSTGPEMSDAVRLGLTALLGLPLFFAIELWLERRGDRLGSESPRRKRVSSRMLLYLVGVSLLGMEYAELSSNESDAIRHAIFLLAAHLLVAFVGYLRRNETNGFWQFNKVILLRILTAAFYSGVLQLGLSLALLAIDKLFQVSIDGETYAQLACILGVFNTWFFLAGVPYSLGSQEERTDYPRGLKIFTQFVLLPLVTIYLAILYPYAIKLLIEWDLPRGWVSNPVLWFAVVGILSFLLLYPIRNEPGNEWIRNFARYFYIALLPLLALPALGIYTRVRDYGITEPRYLVIILTLWLLGIALYFIISKRKDIRLIPITLFIVAILSAVGPWSAFAVSKRNQFGRLEDLLEKHKLLGRSRDMNQKIVVSRADYDEIRSITYYLQYEHEEGELKEWLEDRLPATTVVPKITYDRDIATVLNMSPDVEDRTGSHVAFGQGRTDGLMIKGFDYYVPVRFGARGSASEQLFSNSELQVDHSLHAIDVRSGNEHLRIGLDSVFLELISRRDSTLRVGGNADSISLNLYRTNGAIEAWLAIHNASVDVSDEPPASSDSTAASKVVHSWGEGALFIRLKP